MGTNGKQSLDGYGYNSPFPTRLRALMENLNDISPLKRKVSQTELAKHLGITRQAVSAYTLGDSVPDMLKFKAIADFFGISYSFLLGDSVVMIEDHKDFVHKSGLGSRTLSAILSICENPDYMFSFMLFVESMEFTQIINAITAFIKVGWHGNTVSNETLLKFHQQVAVATGGALRVIPAKLEKDILIMNAQRYLARAFERIDADVRPPKGVNDGEDN